MATDDETVTVHPGDIIQGTDKGHWSHGLIFLVDQTRSWGVEASIQFRQDDEDRAIYMRFKPGQFAVVGAAVLLPETVAQRRKDSLTTAREVAREQAASAPQADIVQRAGGWFVSGEAWSGPWNSEAAAEAARSEDYETAHRLNREAAR